MDIRVPNLGEGAESGSVVNVYVKVGDKVAKDQTLIELENEKAVAPIPCTQAGVVTKVYVKNGDKISVGAPIVQIAGEGAAAALETPAPTAAPQSASLPAANGEYHYASKSGFPPPASPTIRRIAQDLGLDLARIKGSEAGGRIVMADLKNYIAWLQSAQSTAGSASAQARPAVISESIDFSKWGPVSKKPLTSLSKRRRPLPVNYYTHW